MNYDVFISHASEDKTTVAKPLADLLRDRGHRVWLDSFELTVGDSLRERIDHGLSNSRFGVVVLSEHFFQKDWPKRELNGLYAKATEGKKVLLPVWHGITREAVAVHSPLLADCLAANTDQGLGAVADALDRAISLTRSLAGPPQAGLSDQHAKPRANALQGGGVVECGGLYVARKTDGELLQRLERKQHGLISLQGPRHMGKSSLLSHLSGQLMKTGRRIVRLDMAALGPLEDTPDAWISYFAQEIGADHGQLAAPAVKSLEKLLLSVRDPAVVMVDEVDALPDSALHPMVSVVSAVVGKPLQRESLTFLLAFEPIRSSLADYIAPRDHEFGYHVRLPPFTISETQRLFELAAIHVSPDQLTEVHRLTGGIPLLVQLYAIDRQHGRGIDETTKALLEDGSVFEYHIRRLLRASDWRLLSRLARGRPLSDGGDARRLLDLEIISRGQNGWQFSSGLVLK